MRSVKHIINVNDYEGFIKSASSVIETAPDDSVVVVMYADITGFQLVNDFYGFGEGDRFLKAVDEFFMKIPKTRVSGRIFSDHFLCLAFLNADMNITRLQRSYEENLQEFLEEQNIYHPNCRLSLSCGCCVVEQGIKGLVKAVDDANIARKEAKNTGHTSVIWFDNAMRQEIKEQKDMEIAIQSALREAEFSFYLQPKVNLNTGKVVGTEALARWIKPDGTMVYPDAFIPIMEHNGSIVELDFLIYRKVCEYLEDAIQNGKRLIPVSVNMSRIHIFQKNFPGRLHQMAVRHGIPPYLLEFEVTETLLLEEFDSTKQVIDDLRGYGYKVSIDDFGSGFTGVNIWRKLDFDVVKLDKEFISLDEAEMRRNDTIITSITYVGKKRQTTLLCEGVETKEQCRHMKELGCEIAQGYYFSKPLAVDDFEREMDYTNGYYPVLWAEKVEKQMNFQSVEEWERLQLDNFYREIYDSVDCGIIQYKEDDDIKNVFHCISLNHYAVELYGFTDKEQGLSPDVDIVNDFILSEDIERCWDKIKSLNHPGDSVLLDFRIRRCDGEIRFLTGTLKIILDQGSNKIFLGVLVDKSEKQQMAILKDRLNIVMENTPGDIITITAGQKRFQVDYLITGCSRTFGHSIEEFQPITEKEGGLDLIWEPDRAVLIERVLEAAQKRGSINLDFHVVHKNGILGWHNLSADYYSDSAEGDKVYHGIITDITRFKRQEEALERSERRYHVAAVMARVDIWTYDIVADELILPVSEELSGLQLNGIKKMPLAKFLAAKHIHADSQKAYIGMYKKACEEGGEVTGKVLGRVGNDSYEWFCLKCSVLARDEAGRPLEILGVAQRCR